LKSFLTFCFALLVATLGVSQSTTSWLQAPAGQWDRSFVTVRGEGNFIAQGINNRFLLPFATSDTISRDARIEQIDALKSDNLIGVDYDIGLSAKIAINERFSALVNLGDRFHLDATAPADAFSLVFLGNKSFAGDTAQLSGLLLRQVRYQQIGIGGAWHAAPNFSAFAMASILKGEQLQELDLETAWLYTSAIGDTLEAGGEGTYHQSDTGNTGFDAFNGWGGSLTMGAQFVANAPQSQWVINILVKDLGWIGWNDQSLRYKTDTIVQWTGVEIESFENLGDSTINGFDGDSLTEDFLGPLQRGRTQRLLPGWVQVHARQQREKGWVNGLGLVMRWRAQFRPYAWVESGYQFNTKLSALAYLGYGGYGTAQFGAEVQYWGESVMAGLQLQNLEAWMLPAELAGAGLRLSLGYRF